MLYVFTVVNVGVIVDGGDDDHRLFAAADIRLSTCFPSLNMYIAPLSNKITNKR